MGLTYNCICQNGTAPDVTAYTYTLPYYICQATFGQCINNHPNDAQGQQTCTDNEKCGTLNATAASTSSSSSSASESTATSTASTSGSNSGSSSAAAGSPSNTGAAVATNQQLATGAMAAVLLAAFKLVL